MTKEELNYIKDAFSQIIEDIAGNPDWHKAARSVASDLGTLERELEEKVASIPSNLDEAAEKTARDIFESLEKHDIGEEKNRVLFGLLELEALALTFSHFGAEWQLNEDAKKYYFIKLKDIKDAWQELKKSNPEIESKPALCFYRGAGWMAGQYKTLGETEIYLEDDGGEEPYAQEWIDLATTEFAIPEGFNPGDKVIIQIRKK